MLDARIVSVEAKGLFGNCEFLHSDRKILSEGHIEQNSSDDRSTVKKCGGNDGPYRAAAE